jgi:hypothetical protein
MGIVSIFHDDLQKATVVHLSVVVPSNAVAVVVQTLAQQQMLGVGRKTASLKHHRTSKM